MDGSGYVAMEAVTHEACRVCANFYAASAEMEFVALFDTGPPLEIIEFIKHELDFWQMKISENDGLPQRICLNCFNKFCGIHTFRLECEVAQQEFWRAMLPEATPTDNDKAATQLQLDYLVASSDVPIEAAEVEVSATDIDEAAAVAAAINLLNGDALHADEAEVAPNGAIKYTPTDAYNIFNAADLNELIGDTSSTSMTATSTTITTQSPLSLLTMEENAGDDLLHLMATLPPGVAELQLPESNRSIEDARQTAEMVRMLSPSPHEELLFASDDLEVMLQGSIIPTKRKMRDDSSVQGNNPAKRMREEPPRKLPTRPTPARSVRESAEEQKMAIEGGGDGRNGHATANDVAEQERAIDNMTSSADLPSSSSTADKQQNSLTCQYCYTNSKTAAVQFKDPEELSQHFFDEHDPTTPYTCPHCDCVYGRASVRDAHVREIHSQLLECEYCFKRLRGPVEVHQRNCAYVGDWRCEVCNTDFVRLPLSRFRAHQRQHDPTSRSMRCRRCSRVFERRTSLTAHERAHLADDLAKSQLSCDECGKVAINDYELKRHKFQKHRGALPVRCVHCNKGFVSITFMKRHVQKFHSNEEAIEAKATNVSCTNCDTLFDSTDKLRAHLQLGRDASGKCCGSIGSTSSSGSSITTTPRLVQYTVNGGGRLNGNAATATTQSHFESPPYQCLLCPRNFGERLLFEEHMRHVHHGNARAFLCGCCNIRCRDAAELRQHIQLAHPAADGTNVLRRLDSNAPQFKCKQCDFICGSEQWLTEHTRIKHAVYACVHCNAKFSLHQQLQKHLKEHANHCVSEELPTEGTGGEETDGSQIKNFIFTANALVDHNSGINGTHGAHQPVRVELINSTMNGHHNGMDNKHRQEHGEELHDSHGGVLLANDDEDDDTAAFTQYFLGGSFELDPEQEIIVQ